MTVATTTNRWSYVGNGVTVAFVYDNRIFAASDLKVYLDGALQTLTTHYTVSGVDASGGGSVTFGAAPGVGVVVLIVRDVPLLQPIAYPEADKFPAASHEKALDRLTVIAQQLDSRIDRSLAFPDNAGAVLTGVLPVPVDGNILMWSGTGGTMVNAVPLDNSALAAAAASAAAAAASAASAAAEAVLAAAAYDSFDDRYLGAKAADPALDNDGNALLTGALYWNTGANQLRVYNGAAWVVAGGNVAGPAGAVSGNVAIFDGASGQIIKDSGVSLGGVMLPLLALGII